jgi:hypothetical protein
MYGKVDFNETIISFEKREVKTKYNQKIKKKKKILLSKIIFFR